MSTHPNNPSKDQELEHSIMSRVLTAANVLSAPPGTFKNSLNDEAIRIVREAASYIRDLIAREVKAAEKCGYERGRADAVMEAIQARNAEGGTKQWLS